MNVLVVVGDDEGIEQYSLHGAGGNSAGGPAYPATPNANSIATNGVRFNSFLVPPSCSPARACWFTGRYNDRNGIGNPIEARIAGGTLEFEPALYLSEVTLPKLFKLAGVNVHTALIGKDHITHGSNNDYIDAPRRQGFDYWCGQERNIGVNPSITPTYYEWVKRTTNEKFVHYVFNTTDITNEAIAYIEERKKVGGDWFCVVNYAASHTPLAPETNTPPTDLYDEATWGDPPLTNAANFKAHIEARDTELGRLLAHIDYSDTTVFYLTDNGTAAPLMQEVHPTKGSYNSSGWGGNPGKGQQYNPGINVPLYVRGAGVTDPGRTHDGYWHAVDLFQTWGELFGIDPAAWLSDPDFPRRPKRVTDCMSFKHVLDNVAGTARTNLVFANFSPIACNALTTAGRRAVVHVNGAGTRYKLMTFGAYPDFAGDGPHTIGQRFFNLTALDAANQHELQGPTADDNPADLLLNTGNPAVLNATNRAAYNACIAVLANLKVSIEANDLQFIPTTVTFP